MKYVVCSVFDKAAAAYGRPFFVGAIGQAIRGFQDEVNRNAEDNPVNKHPDDFDLYYVGTFDDSTGGFVNVEPAPEQLATGSAMKFQKEK